MLEPEARLMSAIFGDIIMPDALIPEVDGLSLKEQVYGGLVAQPRLMRVAQLRYGLEDGKARTRQGTGDILGVTAERVRQLDNKLLKLLRHPTRSRYLRKYIREVKP